VEGRAWWHSASSRVLLGSYPTRAWPYGRERFVAVLFQRPALYPLQGVRRWLLPATPRICCRSAPTPPFRGRGETALSFYRSARCWHSGAGGCSGLSGGGRHLSARKRNVRCITRSRWRADYYTGTCGILASHRKHFARTGRHFVGTVCVHFVMPI